MAFEIENGVLLRYHEEEGVTDVVIPNGVKIIDTEAFLSCNSLRNIKISDGVTKIGFEAFMFCLNLENIIIPDSVTLIADKAFWGCESLKSIIIPDSVVSIGNDAFFGCGNLKSITLPDDITHIGNAAFHTGIVELITVKGNKTTMEINLKAYIEKYMGFDMTLNEIYDRYIDDVFDFICAKSDKKEEIFNKMKIMDLKIPCAIYFVLEYGNKTAKDYLNNQQVVECLNVFSDQNTINRLISEGILK